MPEQTDGAWQRAGVAGDTWDFKAAGEGAEFVGIYKAKKENVGKNMSNLYVFQRESDGKEVGLWGNTVLDGRMQEVPLDYLVKVVYLGIQDSKGGRKFHAFDVFYMPVDPAKRQKITREAVNGTPDTEDNTASDIKVDDIPF